MHIGTVTQLTEVIQAYYDRSGIDEKADVKVKEAAPGSITIELHTNKLLTYEHFVQVSHIVYMLMPIGIMHELVNIVLEGNVKKQTLLDNGASFELDVAPAVNKESKK